MALRESVFPSLREHRRHTRTGLQGEMSPLFWCWNGCYAVGRSCLYCPVSWQLVNYSVPLMVERRGAWDQGLYRSQSLGAVQLNTFYCWLVGDRGCSHNDEERAGEGSVIVEYEQVLSDCVCVECQFTFRQYYVFVKLLSPLSSRSYELVEQNPYSDGLDVL